jgi:sulfofructose kinase
VDRHPGPDEKSVATGFLGCGGGPAANAAVAVARLGGRAGFAGYLGRDAFGEKHLDELRHEGVDTSLVVRGPAPTPISTVLVKPDGSRSLVNYRADTPPVSVDALNLSHLRFRTLLVDGHEPELALVLLDVARRLGVPVVVDAGSVHEGTRRLVSLADHLVCSEKFATEYTGEPDPVNAARALRAVSPSVVVTLGERGLIWNAGSATGRQSAFVVDAIDTTGAGDAFHGAFALGLARGLRWEETLRFAGAVAALCCTRLGARPALPAGREVDDFLSGAGRQESG